MAKKRAKRPNVCRIVCGIGTPQPPTKSNIMGMWIVQVRIDLTPAAGESVCTNPPPVAIAFPLENAGGAAIASAQLINTISNRYEATIVCGAVEPFSVMHKFRFIESEQTVTANF